MGRRAIYGKYQLLNCDYNQAVEKLLQIRTQVGVELAPTGYSRFERAHGQDCLCGECALRRPLDAAIERFGKAQAEALKEIDEMVRALTIEKAGCTDYRGETAFKEVEGARAKKAQEEIARLDKRKSKM